MMFHHQGGVEVGDIDQKAEKLVVPIGHMPSKEEIESRLLSNIPSQRKPFLSCFIEAMCRFYVDLNADHHVNTVMVGSEL